MANCLKACPIPATVVVTLCMSVIAFVVEPTPYSLNPIPDVTYGGDEKRGIRGLRTRTQTRFQRRGSLVDYRARKRK